MGYQHVLNQRRWGQDIVGCASGSRGGKPKNGTVAIIDTDPQASLAGWWNLREAETPAFVQTTLKDLPEQLKALMDTGYQVVVIDTPGADVSFTRSILKHCDLAMVPVAPVPARPWHAQQNR